MPHPPSMVRVAAPGAAASAPAAGLVLREGQVLAVRVLEVRADGLALLQIGAARVEAKSRSPLTAGQSLALRVAREPGPGKPALLEPMGSDDASGATQVARSQGLATPEPRAPLAANVAPGPARDVDAATGLLRDALPRARPLVEALGVLQRFADAPRGTAPDTPLETARALARDLLASLPRPADAADPLRLAALVESSGLFREAREAHGSRGARAPQRSREVVPDAPRTIVHGGAGAHGADLKARLLGLLQVLRGAGERAPAGAAADLETTLAAAVARIEVNQIASARAAAEHVLLFPVELPFADAGTLREMTLCVRRDARAPDALPDAGWVAEIVVHPPGLGALHARIGLACGRVHGVLTAESDAVRAMLDAAGGRLRALLESAGLEVESLTCRLRSAAGRRARGRYRHAARGTRASARGGGGPPHARAVAIHHDGEGAPRVTAKGEGQIAERIVALAREHGVPLHSDPDLGAFLARVPLGDEIPRALYVAVARLLVFAYEVSGKPVPRSPHGPARQTSSSDSVKS